MPDIVERLRVAEHEWDHNPRLYLEAADEIERLRAALKEKHQGMLADAKLLAQFDELAQTQSGRSVANDAQQQEDHDQNGHHD